MKKWLLLLILPLFLAFKSEENNKIYGIWWNPEKTSKVKIFKATDGKVYGKIIWLKVPNDESGNPRTDIYNPEVSKRKTPLMDLVFLRSFVYDGDNEWDEGTIYDPKNGKTYSCTMTLKDDKTLEVRGYVGISLIGRTATFTKAE